MMKVALASPRPARTLESGLETAHRLIAEASASGAEVVCFPEAWLPGLRGQDFPVLSWDEAVEQQVLGSVSAWAAEHRISTILCVEHVVENGRQIAAAVFGRDGQLQGWQTKNQLDPSEDEHYVPGSGRQLFDVNGTLVGITICHEGWRYPETVRWAAQRGARVVFHLQHTGNDRQGISLTDWGSPQAPYYERAMACRGLENTIWFASVNYALRFQESATSIIDPSGMCAAWQPYGEEGVLVHDIDLDAATGLIARRFSPERHAGPHSADLLAHLFREAARAHHAAFVDVDGHDPAWPEWYAAFLVERVGALPGMLPSRAELVADLRAVDEEFRGLSPGMSWPHYYAGWFLSRRRQGGHRAD